MIEVFLHGTFAEAQIVRDLLVGFGFGNESYNLLFAEGEGEARLVEGPALRCTACRTSVLFAAGVKTVLATSTTPRPSCASGGHRNHWNGKLFHVDYVQGLGGILLFVIAPMVDAAADHTDRRWTVPDRPRSGERSGILRRLAQLLNGGGEDHVNPVIAGVR